MKIRKIPKSVKRIPKKEIHVSWTALAKIRVQDAGQQLRDVSVSVNHLDRRHKLTMALLTAICEINEIEKLLDETYGKT